ncbi:MAG: hypothetical protein CVT48_02610 [Thermoplasmata archaeon HGW-Thermoplasmata-1]|nr:MAG: hypothetical protein CVT48_02610 [Thermoplasmata archaeon HGW-Thermoplasmata-1]
MNRGSFPLICILSLLLASLMPAGSPLAEMAAPDSTGHNVYLEPAVDIMFSSEQRSIPAILITTYRSGMEDEGRVKLSEYCVENGLLSMNFRNLPIGALIAKPEIVEELSGWNEIEGIYSNSLCRTMLDKSVPYVGAELVWNTYKQNGAGAGVMIIDTGIDGTHPDVRYGSNLVQNAAPSRTDGLVVDYIEDLPSTDLSGHGTHCASIVAGTGNALGSLLPDYKKYVGMAPGAALIGFASSYSDSGAENPDEFDIMGLLAGFDYALEKQDAYNIKVISCSWGDNGDFEPKHPINLATLNCYRAGMSIFFSAGNEGEDGLGTMNRYALAPWVLAVAAGDLIGIIPQFSSKGTDADISKKPYDHPDITAPGVMITAAKASTDSVGTIGGILPTATSGGVLYVDKSGTSMACPHVSGAAALIIAQNPLLSPDQVYDILIATASEMPTYDYWECGAGYLNVLEAYRLAVQIEGTLDYFKSGNYKYAGDRSGDPGFSWDPLSGAMNPESSDSGGANPSSKTEMWYDPLVSPLGIALAVGLIVMMPIAFTFKRK